MEIMILKIVTAKYYQILLFECLIPDPKSGHEKRR